MCDHCINRREFGSLSAAGLTGAMLGLSSALPAAETAFEEWDPDQPPVVTGRPLRVQPILAHGVMTPREKTSWRSWGDIINEQTGAEEMVRIAKELKTLAAKADFPLEVLPAAKVTTVEQAAALQKGDFDAVLLYAASNAGLFHACSAADPKRDTIVFVRHKSGATYYGYECLGVRFFPVPSPELWRRNSADNHGPVTLDDVVVDDYDEVLWRLRALYGLKNFVGQRMLALGGALGKWDASAPDVARTRYKLDIVPIEYKELAARLAGIQSNSETPGAVRRLDRSLPGFAQHRSWRRKRNSSSGRSASTPCSGSGCGSTRPRPLPWLRAWERSSAWRTRRPACP